MTFKDLSSKEILGLTVIGEGRGEPIESQVAIACSCRNRLHDNPIKYKTYLDVCLEPNQFSCFLSNDLNYGFLTDLTAKLINGTAINDIQLLQCLWVADGVFSWSIVDNTKGARNYMTLKLFNSPQRPKWADKITNATTFGSQIYFNA